MPRHSKPKKCRNPESCFPAQSYQTATAQITLICMVAGLADLK
jgi:hypothetical protein